jgi:pimeloyl-ACP methyl ester carboxylesterase
MEPAKPRIFVLVAGAWHGAWCWERLVPLLVARGHRVLTPELAGTGASDTDPASVSLESWARGIADLCAVQTEPVTLLGHSRGGIVISRAAELEPRSIQRLVYLCAYLLPAGAQVAAEARIDPDSLVPANMLPSRSGITCTMRSDAVHDAFYSDCDPATVAWASARLSPEPLKPLITPMKCTPERFGRVPRAYIECTRDRTIGLAAQRRMQAALPCDPVFTLDSAHSPFLSRAEELAALLDRL